MRRILIIATAVWVSATSLPGQSAEDAVVRLKNQGAETGISSGVTDLAPGETVPGPGTRPAILNGSWNISAGTSFSYSPMWGSGFGFYAAPLYTLPVTDRWAVHAGVVASTFSGLQTPRLPEQLANPGRSTGLSVFAAASYRASERLVLHGSGTKQLVSTPLPNYFHSDQFTLGATYRLGDNVTIGASVRVRNSPGFDRRSPFADPVSVGSPLFVPYGW